MAKITYNGEAEQISWFGVTFEPGRAVETDKPELIAAAEKNDLFDVQSESPSRSGKRSGNKDD